MSALSDSGQMPIVQQAHFVSPTPSFSSFDCSILHQVSSQYLKESILAETNFGLPDDQHGLIGATLEEWLLFCNQCYANVIGYSENPAFPDLSRRDFANAQMRAGCMVLCHNPDANAAKYLLAPAKITVSTCTSLAQEGHWNTALCCAECHVQQDFTEIFFAGDDPFAGKKGRRRALGCCRLRLLPDYYPGRWFSSQQLDTHDDDDDDCIDKD